MQWSSLQSAEEERKARVWRLQMEKAAAEGKGFGPPPKQPSTTLAPRVSLHAAVTEESHTLCALLSII